MRLLDTHTGRFVEKDPRKERIKYAILSHVWDQVDGEQTYQQLKKLQKRYAGECMFAAKKGSNHPPLSSIWDDVDLSPKILNACGVARKNGYQYIWIDSCCIDKTSSSELSEAINSMFAWYKGAGVCYAYLADVPPDQDPQKNGSAFRNSQWFKRGWTLQELLAPKNVVFLSMDWARLGTKDKLAKLINVITDISVNALSKRESLFQFSVAQRFSWAARRETTRVEDRAYSLLGIFNINMPTLYGEGEGAFQRLQEEILRRIPDSSIFAWGDVYLGPQILSFENWSLGPTQPQLGHGPQNSFRPTSIDPESMLSPSPNNFVNGRSIEAVPLTQLLHHYPDLPAPDYSFTPHGIRTQMPLIPLDAFLPGAYTRYLMGPKSDWYLAVLGCEHTDRPGHLLAQICYVKSSTSGIKLLSRGRIEIFSTSSWEGPKTTATVVALSAEALGRSSALARVVPVYLSYLSQVFNSIASNHGLLNRPHKMINLLLKRKNDAPWPPSSTGSSPSTACVDKRRAATMTRSLRWPDQDHPNTHWLTISQPALQGTTDGGQDTITIKYTYTLENDGRRLTILADISGTVRGHSIIPVSVSLLNKNAPWIKLRNEVEPCTRVVVDNGKGSTAEVELSLEYLAPNHYMIDAWFNDLDPQFHQPSHTAPYGSSRTQAAVTTPPHQPLPGQHLTGSLTRHPGHQTPGRPLTGRLNASVRSIWRP